MATKTQIIVQPYTAGKKGILSPGPAIQVKTAEAGRLRAERMMAGGRVAGVAVVQAEADDEAGDYVEPVFLARLGQVPRIEA